MANVWEAMKKHRAEQQSAESAPAEAEDQAPQTDDQPGPKPAEPPPSGGGSPRRTRIPLRKMAEPDLVVPHVEEDADYADVLVAHHDRGSMITEQYRALRTNLFAQYTDGRFSLAITSAEAGEGKTVTAMNLALVLAERSEYRTIVVDGDLRKCRLGHLLNIERSPGLSEVLRGEASIEEVIRPTVYPNLAVMTAGRTDLHEVSTLLGGPALPELMHRLEKMYDHVLLDTPPVNVVSDTGMLGRVVGEALMVLRMNKTRRESVEKAVRLLNAAKIKVAGMVLTHQKYYIPNYIYRYS